ncbi:hypothetical protein [Enterococcus sp. DIV0756]|uniref:hypothetical protein n=1 Tax=Enterococcus sp. DIV0756 TaxID=2774636 RepID=UPI003F1F9188
MENFIDKQLDTLFGGLSLQINVIAGALLIVIGIIVLIAANRQSPKRKTTAGWILIGLGILAVLSGVLQGIVF